MKKIRCIKCIMYILRCISARRSCHSTSQNCAPEFSRSLKLNLSEDEFQFKFTISDFDKFSQQIPWYLDAKVAKSIIAGVHEVNVIFFFYASICKSISNMYLFANQYKTQGNFLSKVRWSLEKVLEYLARQNKTLAKYENI